MRKVLNVGGFIKQIPLPPQYDGWDHVLLDIDATVNPDVVCDARSLTNLPGAEYDAVYCSHNLEHYYRHDVPKVLNGFRHVLKPTGFAHILVPDIGQLFQIVVEKRLDIADYLYRSDSGPITVMDVLYGYGPEIEKSGQDFFCHKIGFTEKYLIETLRSCGFHWVFTRMRELEIRAVAFINQPDPFAVDLFKIVMPDSQISQ